MEQKTKVTAEDGKQEVRITREFELPVELLFKAHTEPEIIEQYMSNPYSTLKVLKFEGKKHGSYQYESKDMNGKIVFRANGAIHELDPGKKITRTFEIENAPFGVQLEIYSFEKLTDDTSKLSMHVIYESGTQRDQVLKMGMPQGIGMAHDRMQEIVSKLK
jgi:uncharacterized protein YndB with AHSA1/START domain